jgi:hypothetical protein
MNDEYDRVLFTFCRTSQIPFNRAVAIRGLHDLVAHLYSFVIRRHLLRPCVIWSQALEDCRDRQAANCELAGAVEESATVDVTVLVFVK